MIRKIPSFDKEEDFVIESRKAVKTQLNTRVKKKSSNVGKHQYKNTGLGPKKKLRPKERMHRKLINFKKMARRMGFVKRGKICVYYNRRVHYCSIISVNILGKISVKLGDIEHIYTFKTLKRIMYEAN